MEWCLLVLINVDVIEFGYNQISILEIGILRF